jgi:hypothetical protein
MSEYHQIEGLMPIMVIATLCVRMLAGEASAGEGVTVSDNPWWSHLKEFHLEGSASLNWRNIGPEAQDFETQIQDEVYLADLYFGLKGPVLDRVPFIIEWYMPTPAQGQVLLNQLNLEYDRIENWKFQVGKFLVPFDRYNELYRPDQFLTATRPLIYASPDSLDLFVRVNSPRPPVSSGYTDIGARASYYPPWQQPLIPAELTFYVVNGLSEAGNRQRTFPSPENLGVPAPPGNGVNIDFGHQNNNLADNNNNKAVGARVVYSAGDFMLPWPVPEGALDLQQFYLGFSGMTGQYDLEGYLNYQVYGVDLSFDYFGWNFTGEYIFGTNQFLAPLEVSLSSPTLQNPAAFTRDFEIDQGYYLQASFPLVRKPRWGERVTGIVAFNQMFRRGPQLDLFLNAVAEGTTFPSISAEAPGAARLSTRMDKFTAAVNYKLDEHFFLKMEYSYWIMGKASVISVSQDSIPNVYQTALSLVAAF